MQEYERNHLQNLEHGSNKEWYESFLKELMSLLVLKIELGLAKKEDEVACEGDESVCTKDLWLAGARHVLQTQRKYLWSSEKEDCRV